MAQEGFKTAALGIIACFAVALGTSYLASGVDGAPQPDAADLLRAVGDLVAGDRLPASGSGSDSGALFSSPALTHAARDAGTGAVLSLPLVAFSLKDTVGSAGAGVSGDARGGGGNNRRGNASGSTRRRSEAAGVKADEGTYCDSPPPPTSKLEHLANSVELFGTAPFSPGRVAAAGALIGLGAGVGEELLFRCALLRGVLLPATTSLVSMAMVAGGVGATTALPLEQLLSSDPTVGFSESEAELLRDGIAGTLAVVGSAAAFGGWHDWASDEHKRRSLVAGCYLGSLLVLPLPFLSGSAIVPMAAHAFYDALWCVASHAAIASVADSSSSSSYSSSSPSLSSSSSSWEPPASLVRGMGFLGPQERKSLLAKLVVREYLLLHMEMPVETAEAFLAREGSVRVVDKTGAL